MTTAVCSLPMLWQSCQEYESVANDLFSENREHMAVAWSKIEGWKRKGKVHVLVEISAGLIDAQLMDDLLYPGGSESAGISENMLRTSYAMSIQRLVNAVADEPYGRNPSKPIRDRAADAGLPQSLVNVRNEAAHRRLPELQDLQDASIQALKWLRTNHWAEQKSLLKYAREKLKVKLLTFWHLVAQALALGNPCEDPSGEKEQERTELFRELLDLAMDSGQELVSIIVDDGILTGAYSYEKACTVRSRAGSSDTVPDSKSAGDIGWKFTLRELSSSLPYLPAALLTAIIKYMTSAFSDGISDRNSANSSEGGAELLAERYKKLTILASWCVWLLGKEEKGSSEDCRQLCGDDLQGLVRLKIAVSPCVTIKFKEETLQQLHQACLRTSILGLPLLQLVTPLQLVPLGIVRMGSGVGDVLAVSSVTITHYGRSWNGNGNSSLSGAESQTAESLSTPSAKSFSSPASGGFAGQGRRFVRIPRTGPRRVYPSPSRFHSQRVENRQRNYAAGSAISGSGTSECSFHSDEETSKRKRIEYEEFGHTTKRLKTGNLEMQNYPSEAQSEYSQESVNSSGRKRFGGKKSWNNNRGAQSSCRRLNLGSPQHARRYYNCY